MGELRDGRGGSGRGGVGRVGGVGMVSGGGKGRVESVQKQWRGRRGEGIRIKGSRGRERKETLAIDAHYYAGVGRHEASRP